MERIMLPVPGDFMIPRFVSSCPARIVFWNSFKDSPDRVVIPMALWDVWVRMYVEGVAMYKPSKMPLTAAKSSVYCCAFFNRAVGKEIVDFAAESEGGHIFFCGRHIIVYNGSSGFHGVHHLVGDVAFYH